MNRLIVVLTILGITTVAYGAPGDALVPTNRNPAALSGAQATQVGTLVTALYPDVPLANIQRFLCWPTGPMAPFEVDGVQVENANMSCRVEDSRRVSASQIVAALAAGKRLDKEAVTPALDGQGDPVAGMYDVLLRSQPVTLSLAQRNSILSAAGAWAAVAVPLNLIMFEVYREEGAVKVRASEKVPQSASAWLENWLAGLTETLVGVE